MDLRLLGEKFKKPVYTYWQHKYYRSIEKEDFRSALKCLRNINQSFKGVLPPYWALELAKVRFSIGHFDKALSVIKEISISIDQSINYNEDTKLFLFKHLEKTHSDILKKKYNINTPTKIESVKYVNISDINFNNVDPVLRKGWPLIS